MAEVEAEKRKRARYIFLGVIGLVVLIVVGILLLWYLGSYENTDDAFVDGHTDPISTRINGTVANVFVENTYRVKKGQLLLELDPRDNQVAKEQAFASYDQAKAAARAQAPQVPITSEQHICGMCRAIGKCCGDSMIIVFDGSDPLVIIDRNLSFMDRFK